MSRVFVTNEPTMSCCGRPRAKCTCRRTVTTNRKPEPLPSFDWDAFFTPVTNEEKPVTNVQPKLAAVGNDWEF